MKVEQMVQEVYLDQLVQLVREVPEALEVLLVHKVQLENLEHLEEEECQALMDLLVPRVKVETEVWQDPLDLKELEETWEDLVLQDCKV